ncbi:hypothetical protein CR513_12739, partial [Mucuna pruriens]
MNLVVTFAFFYLTVVAPWRVLSEQRLLVNMTLVPKARDSAACKNILTGKYCSLFGRKFTGVSFAQRIWSWPRQLASTI